MNNISPEKLERRREEHIEERILNEQTQVNTPSDFKQAFQNKLCDIEIQGMPRIGTIINADDNGILLGKNDNPEFIN